MLFVENYVTVKLFHIIIEQSVLEKVDFLKKKILDFNNFCMLSQHTKIVKIKKKFFSERRPSFL